MSDISAPDRAKERGLREGLFWLLAITVAAMICFGYWAMHRQPASAQSSEQKEASEKELKAWYAVKYCREQAEKLPVGSREAQIAQGACQLLQDEYEQIRR